MSEERPDAARPRPGMSRRRLTKALLIGGATWRLSGHPRPAGAQERDDVGLPPDPDGVSSGILGPIGGRSAPVTCSGSGSDPAACSEGASLLPPPGDGSMGAELRAASSAASAGATEKAFSSLAGVPTVYARGGRPYVATFYSTSGFHRKLEAFVGELRAVAPAGWGPMTSITCAGVYVRKPGMHGLGRAFDWDEVRWRSAVIRPYAADWRSRDPALRRRYLGLDAFLRRWFNYTLDGWYNAAHADHIHADDGAGRLALDLEARSQVAFLQALCNDVYGQSLLVDGVWGPATGVAVEAVKRFEGVRGRITVDDELWRTLMWRAGMRGLHDQPAAL